MSCTIKKATNSLTNTPHLTWDVKLVIRCPNIACYVLTSNKSELQKVIVQVRASLQNDAIYGAVIYGIIQSCLTHAISKEHKQS